jgi:hypothetical protein
MDQIKVAGKTSLIEDSVWDDVSTWTKSLGSSLQLTKSYSIISILLRCPNTYGVLMLKMCFMSTKIQMNRVIM